MIRPNSYRSALFAFALSMLAASHLRASTIQTGTFTSDDELHFFDVSLAGPSNLSIQTFGYGGGNGGFDPFLSLFTQSGLLIAVNNDGACPPLQASGGGVCFDSDITMALPAGSYIAVISQYDNVPIGPTLQDGFSRTGQGNFTPGLWGYPGTAFIDALGNQRTGAYIVSFDGATSVSAAVPEPGLWLTTASGLALCLYTRHRRQKHAVGRT